MGLFDWLMKGIGFESEDDGYDVAKIERQQRKEQKRLEKEARKKEAKNKTEPKGLEVTAGTTSFSSPSTTSFSQPSYQQESFSDDYGQSSYSSGYGSSSGYGMMNGSVGGYGTKNVVFFYPNSYAEVQQLIDYLKQGESVMLNLENIAGGDAQRMLDFSSGAVYALGGCIQQVAPNIFLLTPEGLGIVDSRRGNR